MEVIAMPKSQQGGRGMKTQTEQRVGFGVFLKTNKQSNGLGEKECKVEVILSVLITFDLQPLTNYPTGLNLCFKLLYSPRKMTSHKLSF